MHGVGSHWELLLLLLLVLRLLLLGARSKRPKVKGGGRGKLLQELQQVCRHLPAQRQALRAAEAGRPAAGCRLRGSVRALLRQMGPAALLLQGAPS